MKNKNNYKRLSKLKNPMRNLPIVNEFIETLGIFERYYRATYSCDYGKTFGNIKSIQYINAIGKRQTKNSYLFFRLYEDNQYKDIYKLSYETKTKKIRYATVFNEELFERLKHEFLKFVLNKELSTKATESKKSKTNKI